MFGLLLGIIFGELNVGLLGGEPRPWNFPGSPAVFEMWIATLRWALPSTGVPLVLLAVARAWSRPGERRFFKVLAALVGLNLLFGLAGLAGVAERRSERWEGVRNAIRDRVARVEAQTPASARALDAAGLIKVQKEIASAMPDESVLLPGHGMLRLSPLHYYPWVGVEFGSGRFAVFEDLETMECDYSVTTYPPGGYSFPAPPSG
jgi:hypothetical protein